MIRKDSYKLALAIGHLYGDGGINFQGRVYYCNTEEFLIDEFINSMKIFKVTPWIKKEKNITRVVYSVYVGRKLWSLFGKFSFGKDTKIITSEIESLPLNWKAKLLQAWFNDDGSVVNFPPNYKVIAIHQKLKCLIEFIQRTLNEFGIESHLSEDDGKWLLRIFGYDNLLKFKNIIGFSYDYRKNKKLEEMLKTINRTHNFTKNKIHNLLISSFWSLNQISKQLNLSKNLVYGHLYGWKRKRRKSNPGLIDLGLIKVKTINGSLTYSATSASCN